MKATENHDQYGRAWGTPLWKGGPILGGRDHADFVRRSIAIETARVEVRYETEGPDSPEPRRRAALRYVLQNLGRDLDPIGTVVQILDGQRDSLVRELLERRAPQPVQSLDGEWEVPA